MSAYVRELLKDCVYGRADIAVKVDLYVTISLLLEKGIVQLRHILVVDLYLSGFSVTEIEASYPKPQELLCVFFDNLEVYSGYTDESFVDKYLYKYPKLRKDVLLSAIRKYSKEF